MADHYDMLYDLSTRYVNLCEIGRIVSPDQWQQHLKGELDKVAFEIHFIRIQHKITLSEFHRILDTL